jgi:hypothetical protein
MQGVLEQEVGVRMEQRWGAGQLDGVRVAADPGLGGGDVPEQLPQLLAAAGRPLQADPTSESSTIRGHHMATGPTASAHLALAIMVQAEAAGEAVLRVASSVQGRGRVTCHVLPSEF